MTSRIREIIVNYFENDQSKRVRSKFAAWIREGADVDEKESAMSELWDGLDARADISTERSFERLSATIRSVESRRPAPPVRRFVRAAAILILPFIAAWITWWAMKSPAETIANLDLVECIVPYGQVRTTILPDGSVVKINSGSILIHPKDFTSNREVFLNGAAYFTVTRDEARPFTVKTGDMDIEVLGTVFEVSAYSDGEKLATTLESGAVTVRFKNDSAAPVTITPGEQISLNRRSGQIEREVVNVDNVIAWTRGNMIIQSMSIDEVARCIERRYNMKVYLNSNDYRDERITVKVMGNETAADLMKVLEIIVPGLRYRIEGDKLYIY